MNLIKENELFLLEEIVKRNFAAKYKESILGVIWSFIQPLCTMIILTIVFSTIFKGRVENYPVFILSGKCLYDFFNGSVRTAMNGLKGNKNILQRTAAPKFVFIIGAVLSEFINFLISLIILVAVMIVTNSTFYFSAMPALIFPVLSEVLIVMGLGLTFSIVRVYFTDMQHLWSILAQIIFYATGIFYPMSIIPQPYHDILILNPLYWVTDQFRQIVMTGTLPAPLYVFNLITISCIIFVIGAIVFKTFENKAIIRL